MYIYICYLELKFHIINRQLNKFTKYGVTTLQFKTRYCNVILLRGFDVSL